MSIVDQERIRQAARVEANKDKPQPPHPVFDDDAPDLAPDCEREGPGIAKCGAHAADAAPRLVKVGVGGIFAPLPPVKWTCKGLSICPGRPTQVSGISYSGKSFAVMQLGLEVAAGLPIWGKFKCTSGRVLHLDYEQGSYGTFSRYQSLAAGLSITPTEIDGRLDVVIRPRFYLTDDDAFDVLCTETQGYDLVIIDSLRRATPGVDENDSRIGQYLDLLANVSEKTRSAFTFVHHESPKGTAQTRPTDARGRPRGSSAIVDCSGTIFNLSSGGDGLVTVDQTKRTESAKGRPMDSFGLRFQEITDEHGNEIGLRLVYANDEAGKDSLAESKATYEASTQKVLDCIRQTPGVAGVQAISELVKIRHATVRACLASLGDKVENRGTKNRPTYYVVTHDTDREGE